MYRCVHYYPIHVHLCFLFPQDFLLYSSVQDSAQSLPAYQNDKRGIAIWGRAGKQKVQNNIDSLP